MKIVIIGLGTIGRTILRELTAENHTVTIIDENKEKIKDYADLILLKQQSQAESGGQ